MQAACFDNNQYETLDELGLSISTFWGVDVVEEVETFDSTYVS
jgi:hypothetical protein